MINRHPLITLSLAMGLLSLATTNYAADWNINQLMQLLSQVQSSHVDFVEKKSIAMLDKPITSSGELFYTAPDHLEKLTLKPETETLLLDHDSIVITRRSHSYHLQLADYPALAAFTDSIRGTLAGDQKTLTQNYDLNLQGTMAHWTLQLLPNNTKIKAEVTRIRIIGSNDELRSIEIDQADGDSSVMTITQPVTQ